jgi:signal transduction histidine kinase
VWVLISLARLPSQPGHTVSVSTDITVRKELEEQVRQAQKMEAIGRLAGGIAHDFNNLLTVIIGFSEVLLVDRGLSDDARGDTREVLRAAQSAAGLTKQLLAFSRRQTLAPKMIDVNAIVTDMLAMLARLVGEDVAIVTELAAVLPQVYADPTQMEQVVVNLAVNARDAMPHGGTLRIATRAVELDDEFVGTHRGARIGPHVLLEVGDSGTGMTAEVKSRLFEPFFTTKGLGQGTGLGLATIYGIVKQSRGYVRVDSTPGAGSTFEIYLPVIPVAGEEDA